MRLPKYIIRLVINKSTVSDKEKRRGRKGYWIVLIDRVLEIGY